jgi:hypothetical protein
VPNYTLENQCGKIPKMIPLLVSKRIVIFKQPISSFAIENYQFELVTPATNFLEKIKTLPFLLITRKILSYLAEKPDKNQTTTTPP